VYPVSRYTAERMTAWGVERTRIRVLPASVDGETFRAPAASGREGTVLLTVARLSGSEQAKGIDRVLAALPAVRARFPSVRYRIGGTGDDMPRLRALAERLGVEDAVDFLGDVPADGLPGCLSSADVFVMPSRNEGFGIVLIEALACGVPVIACGLEGSRDALKEGRLGRLVDPTVAGELEGAIIATLAGAGTRGGDDGPRLRAAVLAAFGVDRCRQLVREAFAETA
jgi:glycosyltransferase involved in cell wall biosynthesis